MSEAAEKAKDLVNIALDTYVHEIVPELPSGRRYSGAMVANALGIAERRLNSPDPGAILAERLGFENIEDLARAIRSGSVSGASDKEIAAGLLDYLEAELAISNPGFLERRKA